jgi:hypothetical protein
MIRTSSPHKNRCLLTFRPRLSDIYIWNNVFSMSIKSTAPLSIICFLVIIVLFIPDLEKTEEFDNELIYFHTWNFIFIIPFTNIAISISTVSIYCKKKNIKNKIILIIIRHFQFLLIIKNHMILNDLTADVNFSLQN